jgi:hypothetical protein
VICARSKQLLQVRIRGGDVKRDFGIEARRRLDREYAEIKQVMSELGMAKVK